MKTIRIAENTCNPLDVQPVNEAINDEEEKSCFEDHDFPFDLFEEQRDYIINISLIHVREPAS